MTKDETIKTLVEFFLEEFSNDAEGVAFWLTQNGQDVDNFYNAVLGLKDKP